MDEKKSQIFLYRERKKIRQEIKPISIQQSQKRYIYSFIRHNKNSIIGTLCLLAIQIVLEIALLFFGNFYLYRVIILLERYAIVKTMSLLLIGIILYITVSYFYLLSVKKIVVDFINDLRKRWFKIVVYQNRSCISHKEQSSLIARFSYHISLIQTGFANSIAVAGRVSLSLFFLIIIALFLSPKLLIAVLATTV